MSDQGVKLLTSLSMAVVTIAVAIFISSIWVASTGRKASHHSTPIPSGVFQLAPNAYLMRLDTRTTPEQVCFDGVDPVATVLISNKLHLTYLQCSEDQFWNDHRPLSPTWGQGFIRTMVSPVLWILCAGTFVFAVMVVLPWRRWRASWKASRQTKATGEQQMRELTKSWALGDISDMTYETKSQELYAMGIKPAE